MILTTKGRYAVIAIIELAESSCNKPLTLATIAKKQKISLSYLEQIFSKLRKAGLVRSVKGPGGGYILAKSKINITIADIIRAIGENIKMTRCSSNKKSCIASLTKNGSGNAQIKCKTHGLWRGLENRIYAYLGSVSISDICDGSMASATNDVICQNIGASN